jgi:hypothetical protein
LAVGDGLAAPRRRPGVVVAGAIATGGLVARILRCGTVAVDRAAARSGGISAGAIAAAGGIGADRAAGAVATRCRVAEAAWLDNGSAVAKAGAVGILAGVHRSGAVAALTADTAVRNTGRSTAVVSVGAVIEGRAVWCVDASTDRQITTIRGAFFSIIAGSVRGASNHGILTTGAGVAVVISVCQAIRAVTGSKATGVVRSVTPGHVTQVTTAYATVTIDVATIGQSGWYGAAGVSALTRPTLF